VVVVGDVPEHAPVVNAASAVVLDDIVVVATALVEVVLDLDVGVVANVVVVVAVYVCFLRHRHFVFDPTDFMNWADKD